MLLKSQGGGGSSGSGRSVGTLAVSGGTGITAGSYDLIKMSATENVTAGVMSVSGVSDGKRVTLRNETAFTITLSNTGCNMNLGADIVLAQYGQVELEFNSTLGKWNLIQLGEYS